MNHTFRKIKGRNKKIAKRSWSTPTTTRSVRLNDEEDAMLEKLVEHFKASQSKVFVKALRQLYTSFTLNATLENLQPPATTSEAF